jgi:CTP:molybdopterin cytidylyltransferase MocA/HD superfamily phosphodiesterase
MSDKITALIPAAGYSSRMKGAFKPLLPLGGMTVLERVIQLFRSVGVSDIRVVVGHRADEVMPLLNLPGVCGIFNEHYPEGMFSSVLAGIRSLPRDQEAFFLLPTDIPLVRRSTVLNLLAAYRRGQAGILYPVFEGMRGHPPLISAKYAEDIICWKGEGGLRAFLEQHESAASDVEVADEGILSDMDTPDDYRNILKRYEKYDIPTVRECEVLMTKIFAAEDKIRRHCREVARTALCIGKALNAAASQSAPCLDTDLIVAASLLHDLARKEPSHAAAGARILESMDYPAVAELVKSHVDIHIREDQPVHESEVLYIADKLVAGDRAVSIEERFGEKRKRFADHPEAKAAVERRLANALKIKERIEKQTGKDLYALLSEIKP